MKNLIVSERVNRVDCRCDIGVMCHIFPCQCKFLATGSTKSAEDSYKCRTALKYGVPVVSVDYLYNCVEKGRLTDPDPFLVLGSTCSQLLTSGVIAGNRHLMYVVRMLFVLLYI